MSSMSEHNDTIIYEQPLNETMRICLRLEHLFYQLDHIETDAHQSLFSIIKILEVIDRPDIKSKLTKTLTRLVGSLSQLEQSPQVDIPRLKIILKDLDKMVGSLHGNHKKIGEQLRSNDFLYQVRLQVSNPGGVCTYKAPALMLWLKKSSKDKMQDITKWSAEFSELRMITQLILKLTRQSNSYQTIQAQNGFYHQNLDANLPVQLVRISISKDMNVYPEFSVGKHRLNIRFLTPNFHQNGRPSQRKENFNFDLCCCRI